MVPFELKDMYFHNIMKNLHAVTQSCKIRQNKTVLCQPLLGKESPAEEQPELKFAGCKE